MTLTGINCNDEIFKIKNVHISLLADLGFFPFRSSSSFASSSIAFNPRGVAPQPSPKKFAMTLAEIYSIAGCSFGILGNKKCKSGCIFSVILSINPELLAICMIPIHIATIPDIVIQSATASLQDNAASVTSESLPVTAPYKMPMSIIAPHKRFSILLSCFGSSFYSIQKGIGILLVRIIILIRTAIIIFRIIIAFIRIAIIIFQIRFFCIFIRKSLTSLGYLI